MHIHVFFIISNLGRALVLVLLSNKWNFSTKCCLHVAYVFWHLQMKESYFIILPSYCTSLALTMMHVLKNTGIHGEWRQEYEYRCAFWIHLPYFSKWKHATIFECCLPFLALVLMLLNFLTDFSTVAYKRVAYI